MTTRAKEASTADRFVSATLDLIEEEGGSLGVNLRQVSRRIGCAHTNVYNYYPSYEALLWEAFRRALGIYGDYLTRDLHDRLTPKVYLRRLLTNLATYPEDHTGLYRFIASDPIDMERIPYDILVSVAAMKQWLFDVLAALYAPAMSDAEAERISNIVLAYIDGETLNLINGRVVPGEDVRGRIVRNAQRLIHDLSGLSLDVDAYRSHQNRRWYPTLDLSALEGRT